MKAIHPLKILSTLPSRRHRRAAGMLMAGDDLTIVAISAYHADSVIVKKNAIMMIDFALDAERHEGKSPREAIYKGPLYCASSSDENDGSGSGALR